MEVIECVTNCHELRVHYREMYNEFCEFTTSTRNKILEISEVDKLKVSGDDWWYKYLDLYTAVKA